MCLLQKCAYYPESTFDNEFAGEVHVVNTDLAYYSGLDGGLQQWRSGEGLGRPGAV